MQHQYSKGGAIGGGGGGGSGGERRARLVQLVVLSINRCFIFLGDLARYRELHGENSVKDWTAAERYYHQVRYFVRFSVPFFRFVFVLCVFEGCGGGRDAGQHGTVVARHVPFPSCCSRGARLVVLSCLVVVRVGKGNVLGGCSAHRTVFLCVLARRVTCTHRTWQRAAGVSSTSRGLC